MSVMVEAVIFDLGNVLLTLDWERAARRLGQRTGKSVAELVQYAKEARLVRQLSVGAVSRVEFFDEIAGELGFQGTAAEFDEIWSDMFHLNETMIAVARTLKGKCPRVLLSNTNVIHMESVFARFPAIGELDGHVLSHEVGYEKPDPQIYRYALRRYQLSAPRTVFIDDLAENIAGARAVGLRTIHHRAADTTTQELRSLGLAL